ncbi:tetratricopeptide repeat-containing protein 7 [Elsinoe australis]|uniref:Tetratricopeptide repeat-containing protein 7 n=1 Tax=Elsinoe australis TaxID=40998 RepID=A0A4U7B1I4_9PEZI|nr:tetratricopeptide repeat-containing protein 7 [Elsinoe australis]
MQAEQGEIELVHKTLTVTELTKPQSELDLAELCDIWEHADLLFRHGDYDAALALYRDAATRCNNSLVEGVLVINAGITALHGGRLQLAQEAWLAASDIEALQTLPHFLLGVMAFHKQDFEGAQLAFRKCRKSFASGKAVLDFHHLGLAFRLSTNHVLENEQTAAHEWFQSIMNRSVQIVALELPHDFPGDLIFEPPSRASLIGRSQGTALPVCSNHTGVQPHAIENDRTDS